jgi:hypothetical protein
MNARKAKRKIYQLLEGRVRPRWQIPLQRLLHQGRAPVPQFGGSLRQSVEQVERWRQSSEGQRLAEVWASADMHIHDEAVFVGTVTGQIGGQGYSQNMQNDEDVVAAEHRVRGFMHKLKMRPFD